MAKFNEEICNCLTELYSDGIPLKYCADAVGIARSTIYDWMNKGEKAKSGKYRKFYQDMQRARAKFIQKNMKDIQDNKSWMAKQYLLQVTDPEQFVVAEKQQIEAETKQTIDANVDMNDPRIQANDLKILKELIKDDNGGSDKPTTE